MSRRKAKTIWGRFPHRSKAWTLVRGGHLALRQVRRAKRARRPMVPPWAPIDQALAERRLWNQTEREHADLRDMFPDDGDFLDAVEERESIDRLVDS
jgi:hypothetical protein